MAQKVQVVLTDDVEGGEASETIQFRLDGVGYEIDLNDKHAQELREGLARFVAAGRRTSTGSAPRGRRQASEGAKTSRDPAQTKAIRDWAQANGHKVSPRGRIAAEVVAAYEAAH